MENQEREFNDAELDNLMGGYAIKDPEGHPFKENDMYRESQKKILEEMKQILIEEEEKIGRRR